MLLSSIPAGFWVICSNHRKCFLVLLFPLSCLWKLPSLRARHRCGSQFLGKPITDALEAPPPDPRAPKRALARVICTFFLVKALLLLLNTLWQVFWAVPTRQLRN